MSGPEALLRNIRYLGPQSNQDAGVPSTRVHPKPGATPVPGYTEIRESLGSGPAVSKDAFYVVIVSPPPGGSGGGSALFVSEGDLWFWLDSGPDPGGNLFRVLRPMPPTRVQGCSVQECK